MQKPTVMVPVQRERGKEEGTKGRRERKEKGGEIGGVLGLRIGLEWSRNIMMYSLKSFYHVITASFKQANYIRLD